MPIVDILDCINELVSDSLLIHIEFSHCLMWKIKFVLYHSKKKMLRAYGMAMHLRGILLCPTQ